MLGKIEEEKGTAEVEMVVLGITNLMDMSRSALGVGDGQESGACCSPVGSQKSWDTIDN